MVDLALICIPLYNEMFRGCFTAVSYTHLDVYKRQVIYRGDGSSFALKIEANEIKWYAV